MSKWLNDVNDLLVNFDYQNTTGINQKNIFIIGAPRSGTTILSQVIASSIEVGYVNNLMASFWKIPVVGALLSKKLIKNCEVGYKSNFGQTDSISDIHEFGGFWRRVLNYDDLNQKTSHHVDWSKLLKSLDDIGGVISKPMLYKVFQLYWHLSEFHNLRKDSKWIWIERDIESNVKSILKLRRSVNGNENDWVSAKPIDCALFDADEPEIQVIAQVVLINRWLESELAKIHEKSWIKVDYDALTTNPEIELLKISNFLELPLNQLKLEDFAKHLHPSTISNNETFNDKLRYVYSKLEANSC